MDHKCYVTAFEFDPTVAKWSKNLPDGDNITIERRKKISKNYT